MTVFERHYDVRTKLSNLKEKEIEILSVYDSQKNSLIGSVSNNVIKELDKTIALHEKLVADETDLTDQLYKIDREMMDFFSENPGVTEVFLPVSTPKSGISFRVEGDQIIIASVEK